MKKMSLGYDKMIEFAEKTKLFMYLLMGDELSFEDIANYIVRIINGCEVLFEDEIKTYCNSENNKQFERNKKIKKLCFGGVHYGK